MLDWLHQTQWAGNSATAWLLATATALVGFVLARTALVVVRSRLRRIDAQSAPLAAVRATRPLRAVVEATRNSLLLLLAAVLSTQFLELGERGEHIVHNVGFAIVGVQVALWVNALIDGWLSRPRTRNGEHRGNPVMIGILRWCMQFVVWTTLVLAMLANAGVNITAFVASLGIGGVAVAFGLQTILGDLFSSLSIGLDKPFEVGEFIAFGPDLGTVRHVGLKSTRIDSLRGEQLVISNSRLLEQLVRNYSRMPHRRVVFGVRLPYGTSSDQVRTVIERVREFIECEQHARFDRGHLAALGEYGLEFEFVYYVLDSDYTLYMDIQQRVNLAIVDLLGELDLEFAVPARHVRLANESAGAPAAARIPARGHTGPSAV